MKFLVKPHPKPIDNGLIPFDIYCDNEYVGSVYGPRGSEICYAYIKTRLGEDLMEHGWLKELAERFGTREGG